MRRSHHAHGEANEPNYRLKLISISREREEEEDRSDDDDDSKYLWFNRFDTARLKDNIF